MFLKTESYRHVDRSTQQLQAGSGVSVQVVLLPSPFITSCTATTEGHGGKTYKFSTSANQERILLQLTPVLPTDCTRFVHFDESTLIKWSEQMLMKHLEFLTNT